MKLRVVDYHCSRGGGERFVTELTDALHALQPGWTLELVSAAEALDRYETLFAGCPWIRLRRVPWRRGPAVLTRVAEIPGSGRIRGAVKRLAGGAGGGWAYEVPDAAFDDCDVCFFPWIHRHRIAALRAPTVGVIHDATLFRIPGLISKGDLREERELSRRWVDSEAVLVTGARAAAEDLGPLFGVGRDRFRVIPHATVHARFGAGATEPLPREWTWASGPFLVCVANTFPHKNHEVLFEALAAWERRIPLVLAGPGTEDIATGRGRRGRNLKRLAGRLGLRMGKDLIPLGYVPDARLASLLRAAWASCIPTRAEGYGFPLQEALQAGLPVVCSDIPVLREVAGTLDAPVLWFDPADASSLADRLRELQENHESIRGRVAAAARAMRRRTWDDVAAAYADLFLRAASART